MRTLQWLLISLTVKTNILTMVYKTTLPLIFLTSPSTIFSLVSLLQPYWLPSFFSNMAAICLPQGLCTYQPLSL